jgi:phage shock protein A
MGLFGRISDIISANFNDMVENFEDPEKMLRQAIREMETTIDQTRDATARTMADEKMIQKELELNRRQVSIWSDRAATAVADNNDDLARKALARKQEHEKLVAALEDQLAAAHQAGQTCQRQLKAMQVKLAEAKRRLDTLIARKRAADVRAKVTAISSNSMPDVSAFAKFDRMREKVEHAEAHADAMRELITEAEPAEVFPDSPIDTVDAEIEAELAALKKKRGN